MAAVLPKWGRVESKEKVLKGKLYLAMGVLVLGMAPTVHGQMGLDLFRRPSIGKAFHPVVGKGAQYETSGKGGGAKTHTMDGDREKRKRGREGWILDGVCEFSRRWSGSRC